MSNIIENAFLLGLGALSVSKATAENLIKEAVKKAEISENEGDSLLKTFTAEGEKAKAAIEKAVDDIIKSKSIKIIPAVSQIEELEKKVADLETRLAALENTEN